MEDVQVLPIVRHAATVPDADIAAAAEPVASAAGVLQEHRIPEALIKKLNLKNTKHQVPLLLQKTIQEGVRKSN